MQRLGYKRIETNYLFQRLKKTKKFIDKPWTQTHKPTPYQKANPKLTRSFGKERQETENLAEAKLSKTIND